MHKKRFFAHAHALLLILLITVFCTACAFDRREQAFFSGAQRIRGEYCRADGEWRPLQEDAILSALDGNVKLGVRFAEDVPKGRRIVFQPNHISYRLSVNGVCLARSSADELGMEACRDAWDSFISPGITQDDLLEMDLSNQHRAGNENAYEEFLRSFHLEPAFDDAGRHGRMHAGEKAVTGIAGVFALGWSLVCLGFALGFARMHLSFLKNAVHQALLFLGIGGYLLLDILSARSDSPAAMMLLCARQACLILTFFELWISMAHLLSGVSAWAARSAVCAGCLVLALLAALGLTGAVQGNEMLDCLHIAQLVIGAALLICCGLEWKKNSLGMHAACLCGILTASVAENLGLMLGWQRSELLLKTTFILLLVIQIIWGIGHIAESLRKADEWERLNRELTDSRIALSMGQIRNHFIFNMLNAISGMCKYDPEKADMAIVAFARYLRSNIERMEDGRPIAFQEELAYLRGYVELEQIRFGDRIHFVTDVQISDFCLPPMVLQPLVENAIRHGLTPKPDGGTVALRTRSDEKNVYVLIEDDGAGFDMDTTDQNRSVGLSNVRFRLHNLMRGSLSVVSREGGGTTATITIPRKEAEGCI